MQEASRSQNDTGGRPHTEMALIKTYRTPGKKRKTGSYGRITFRGISKKHGDKI
jgi:hypothetical protein